ncbi:hypothetical protein V1506DRAFT_464452, partial [Lipomyces tetrasporus]
GDFPNLRERTTKQDMRLHLRAFQLADTLSYEEPVVDLSDEKRQKNENGLSALVVNMDTSYQKLYLDYEQANNVWKALQTQFALIWSASKPQLACKLYGTQMKDDTSLEDHFQHLTRL